jgi:hypothetical protein
MRRLQIRFCTEGDELDAVIAKTQYEFWATHCEVIFPDGQALRFDDDSDRWRLENAPDQWIRQVIVEIWVSDLSEQVFYEFLERQIGSAYDIRPYAGVRCDFDARDGKRWQCADLVYAAMLEAGIIKSNPRELQFLTPRDLLVVLGALVVLPPTEVTQANATASNSSNRGGESNATG